jgi:hypothetical protein
VDSIVTQEATVQWNPVAKEYRRAAAPNGCWDHNPTGCGGEAGVGRPVESCGGEEGWGEA